MIDESISKLFRSILDTDPLERIAQDTVAERHAIADVMSMREWLDGLPELTEQQVYNDSWKD